MPKTEQVAAYSLSDGDIKQMLGADAKVIPYPELEHMTDIDQCFDRKGRCILLFLRDNEHSGHWCCLLRHADHIEFFDPYGEKPQAQTRGIPQTRLERMGMDEPFLERLLKAKGIPVYYNTHRFQQLNNSIATCGRHCVVRCLYSKKSLDAYANLIKKSGLTPDEFVSGVTFKAIGK
jgi:hypothetical protein